MAIWSQPLLSVRDVPTSSRWYQRVLDADSGHRGEYFEHIVADGEIIVQLHRIDVADHHDLLAQSDAALGNGVIVWFEVDDFESAVARVRAQGARIETEPHENPNAGQREIWLTDPDGYRVVIAGPSVYRPRQ